MAQQNEKARPLMKVCVSTLLLWASAFHISFSYMFTQ